MNDSKPQLHPDDRRLVDAIAEAYQPEPMSHARRAAFGRALDERLQRRGRGIWTAGYAVAATACAVAIYLWMPLFGGTPDRRELTAANDTRAATTLTFVDPDLYEDDGQTRDYLPDDYVVLAGLFQVPVDDPPGM